MRILVTFLCFSVLHASYSETFQECGLIKESVMSPLIMHASPTTSANWPWYTAIYLHTKKDTWEFSCGGSILSERLVITAAHCLWTVPATEIKVTAGSSFSDFDREEPGKQIADVSEVIIHDLYFDALGNFGSDIALIKLKTPFVVGDFVQVICLDLNLRNIMDLDNFTMEGKVIGMGITESGSTSLNLQEARVELVSTKGCIDNQMSEFKKYVTVATFCGKGINGSVICNGDSGGGFAIKDPVTGKWMLEGVVSISPKDPRNITCDPKYYTIFTKVGLFVSWIKRYVNDSNE
ncbi:clotting factor C-like [Anthonomus grandis grandis]|uniref:clotting factor C-like n=1 Tax=Anthonomus grandis grandis TaxID=2921223 RepID=UPI002165C2CC|nr:clotting factor C-like [Anthonomus grandis grandis]